MWGTDKNAALVTVACDICGRILHDEEDTLPDKGTDGTYNWCSTEHSPEFMAGVAAWREYELVEAERVKEESLARFLQIVRDTVNDEIAVMKKAGKL